MSTDFTLMMDRHILLVFLLFIFGVFSITGKTAFFVTEYFASINGVKYENTLLLGEHQFV